MRIAYMGSLNGFKEYLKAFKVKSFNEARLLATLEDDSTICFVKRPESIIGYAIDEVYIDEIGTFSPEQIEIVKRLVRTKSCLPSTT